MLYPKIKNKESKLEISIKNVILYVKDISLSSLNIFKNSEYFILFVRKSFHF